MNTRVLFSGYLSLSFHNTVVIIFAAIIFVTTVDARPTISIPCHKTITIRTIFYFFFSDFTL